ncbi:hypothetical protein P5673_009303 [Acropora cervicornis]|uniref:Uncharacterized protein n=1 Tax=Acropora cervicornis TaxID=6130 RepID=A0AAD9V9V7_ACRCE|nr:hypothetical protein P5673_009303 [Acropora cervicornis]
MSLKVELFVFIVSNILAAFAGHEVFGYPDAHDSYGNGDGGDINCPSIVFPPELGGSCRVRDFCSKVTCVAHVRKKQVRITFQINRCEQPLTATVTFKSHGFSVDWSYTFKDGDVIKLPQDDKRLSYVGKLTISLKLELMGDADESLNRQFHTTPLDGQMLLSSNYCGFSAWFSRQPQYIKILIITGPVLALICFFLFAACGCCNCWKRRAPARLQVNIPSHRLQISPVKNKLPRQRLINEA